LWVRLGAYPRVEHLKCALIGEAPGITCKLLGWEGLPRTNTLAYYKDSYITAIKSFIGLALKEKICQEILRNDCLKNDNKQNNNAKNNAIDGWNIGE
jgi:hypothetical protein